MIAADTSRSRAYLQALVRHELLPAYVILLADDGDRLLPGQLATTSEPGQQPEINELDECWSEARFDASYPVKALLDDCKIAYEVTENRDINSPSVIDRIRQRKEEVFIYSGFGGVLLKREVLSIEKKFLHVHGGYLPDYKGSTTNYFSMIVENTLGASSLFLSEEIDSGPVLQRRKFPPPIDRKAIDHVYDSGARAKVLIETLQHYLKSGEWEYEIPENTGGETYYIIHPVLKHIAILGTRND